MPSNFGWSATAGARRPPPPSARHGAPLPDPPRLQLILHRASPHRPKAPRPLPRRSRPPERCLHRSPPPPVACSRRAAAIGHPDPKSGLPQVRKNLVMLPRPSTLTAGDRRRRIWPVKPAPPSLTTAKGLRLKDTKAQGAVCKAYDSDE
jgi:hypothetical protein